MAANFEYVTLPIDTLVYAQGLTQEEAFNAVKESQLNIKEFYTFDLVITQAGKESIVYLVFGVLDGEKIRIKGLDYVTFKHHNFVKLTIEHDDYEAYLRGKFKDELEAFLKAQDHKLDLSKVFGLIKKEASHIEVYMQYK